MQLSVIIITRNEAPRLSLCLTSVHEAIRKGGASEVEVIVIDDGSTDSTEAVVAEYLPLLPLRIISNERCQGRSRSRNRGAADASGETVLFLDGDTIVSPDCFARHLEAHRESAKPTIFRGEVHHFRQTRFFKDPRTGEPFPDSPARPTSAEELITERDLRERFGELSKRASPGIYPGSVPRAVADLELSALRKRELDHSLWMTVSAHNLSLSRERFTDVGGFDERLDMNEHRDLALTLFERHGMKVRLVESAPSYHLTHSSRWRDPIEVLNQWEPLFLAKHATQEARLLPFFWMTLAHDERLPQELRITTIEELIERARHDISPFEHFRSASLNPSS